MAKEKESRKPEIHSVVKLLKWLATGLINEVGAREGVRAAFFTYQQWCDCCVLAIISSWAASLYPFIKQWELLIEKRGIGNGSGNVLLMISLEEESCSIWKFSSKTSAIQFLFERVGWWKEMRASERAEDSLRKCHLSQLFTQNSFSAVMLNWSASSAYAIS